MANDPAPAVPPAAVLASDASPGSPNPQDGRSTVDDNLHFEPLRLSYAAADSLAHQIAAEVRSLLKAKTVVIVNKTVLADLANLRAFHVELERLLAAYKGLSANATKLVERRVAPPLDRVQEITEKVELPEAARAPENFVPILTRAVASVAAAATAGMPAVAALRGLAVAGQGLVSLFRQDVALRGLDTPIDSIAFELALGGYLRTVSKHEVSSTAREQLFEPPTVYLGDLVVLPAGHAHAGSLEKQLDALETARTNAWRSVGPLITQLVELDAKVAKAAKDKDQAALNALTADVTALRRDLQPVSDPLSRADLAVSDLTKIWMQADAATGLTPLSRLLRAESLERLQPMYLHCAIAVSGGHSRIVHTLWRTLFSGDGISFQGGAVAQWGLLDRDGSLLAGGIKSAKHDSSHV